MVLLTRLHIKIRILNLFVNIRLGWMAETNTLAYYEGAIEKFYSTGPVANVIKLFTAISYDFS